MKKSKILVPAVAVLLLSGAAASTATVAWFQSIRRVDLDLANVHVVNTNSVLEVSATALQGTTVTNSGTGHSTQTVNFEPLTHGSYDSASHKAFGVVFDDYGGVLGYSGGFTDFKAYEDDAANSDVHGSTALKVNEGSAKQVYYAVSFKLTFTLTTTSTNDYALLFDHKVSTVEYTDGTSVSTTDPIKGYRLCLEPTGGDALVWAPKTSEATLTDLKYVKQGSTKGESTTYGTESVNVIKTTSADAEKDGVKNISTLSALENYVGTLSSSSTSLEVIATAWFEGEDANVVNAASNIAKDIKSTMSFYAVKAAL